MIIRFLPTHEERPKSSAVAAERQALFLKRGMISIAAGLVCAALFIGITEVRSESKHSVETEAASSLIAEPTKFWDICREGAWYCFTQPAVTNHNLYANLNRNLSAEQLPAIGRVQATDDSALPILSSLMAPPKKNQAASLARTLLASTSSLSNTAAPAETPLNYASGRVDRSLTTAVRRAGLNASEVAQLSTIFQDKIDFKTLRPGDQFHILYQRTNSSVPANTSKAKSKNSASAAKKPAIVLAEIVTKGTRYQAIRYTDRSGRTNYYTPEGNSLQRGFLRYPVANAHVSSGFTKKRLDPILQIYRPHEAVDFNAPLGTPVKATGDGKITTRAYKNGYGNVVEIAHAQQCNTLYAHLSRFATDIRPGASVKQGQVIGYVGQTGHATGPHVHYEFRMKGERRDPLSVQLPGAPALAKNEKNRFQLQATRLLAQLEASERVVLATAVDTATLHG